MKNLLVKFYLGDKMIWINPAHVVAVERKDDSLTDIWTVKWAFTVKGTVDEVVRRLGGINYEERST